MTRNRPALFPSFLPRLYRMIHKPSYWQKEDLILDGDQYYLTLISWIQSARRQIDLETYIFDPDAIGEKVTEALVQAAGRGVRVRVLVDGVGAYRWPAWLNQRWKDHKLEARVYKPLPWPLSTGEIESHFQLTGIRRFFNRVNRRLHRKTCVIDDDTLIMGSFNISTSHSRQYRGDFAWHDAAVVLQGEGVIEVRRAFERSWRTAKSVRKEIAPEALALRPSWMGRYVFTGLIRLNHLRILRRFFFRDFVERIQNAERRVWVMNPYFVPDHEIIQALRRAAYRGVDVKLVVPRITDVKLVRLASRTLYGWLILAGVQIYEYLPSFLHAKINLVDDWMTVGSSNLNHRSLFHDLEVDAVITHATNQQQLEQHFLNCVAMSEGILLEKWSHRAWWEKLAGRMALLMKNWI